MPITFNFSEYLMWKYLMIMCLLYLLHSKVSLIHYLSTITYSLVLYIQSIN